MRKSTEYINVAFILPLDLRLFIIGRALRFCRCLKEAVLIRSLSYGYHVSSYVTRHRRAFRNDAEMCSIKFTSMAPLVNTYRERQACAWLSLQQSDTLTEFRTVLGDAYKAFSDSSAKKGSLPAFTHPLQAEMTLFICSAFPFLAGRDTSCLSSGAQRCRMI